MEQKNEDLAAYRRKLKFRSWHRGTREMDLLMGSFADKYVDQFNDTELKQFEQLLTSNDPDLYNWVTGQEQPPANDINPVFQKFLAHRIVE
jgi:antitoxin CptB